MQDTSIILIITIGTGFLALICRYCFRSKCSDITLCNGVVRIHRAVELEEQKIEDAESSKV
jgi:hypothetical protein